MPLQVQRFRVDVSTCGGSVSALHWTAVSLVQDDVSGRGDVRVRSMPRAARAGLRLQRRAPDARGDREAAEEPLALPRAAADHRRAAHRIQLRLHAARALRPAGERLGVSELYIKDDSVNHPTLSYKDRVVSVAATRAVELGFKVLACASTGNLANSVAAHAARLGIECCVFIPDNLEAGKLLGSAIFNPTILAIAGNYDDVNRLCTQVADRYGWGFVNINLRSYYAEGAKTMRVRDRRAAGLALSEASGRRRSPAARCCRASSAGCASCARSVWWTASCRASMRRRRPAARRSSTRSSRASSIRSRCGPDTIAKSIAIGNPADGYQVMQTVRATGGTGAAVTDEQIVDAIQLLARDRRDLHRAGGRHDARGGDRPDPARRHSARRIDRRLRDGERLQDGGSGGRTSWPKPVRSAAAFKEFEAWQRSRGRRSRSAQRTNRPRSPLLQLETIGSLNSIVRPSRSTLTVAVEPIFASATMRKNCDGSSMALAVEADDHVAGPDARVEASESRLIRDTSAPLVFGAPTSSASCGVSFSMPT